MLHVTTERISEGTIWKCAGQLVRGEESARLLERVIAANSRRVLLDLSGVDTVDARGLGILICMQRWCHAKGAELCLINPSTRMREILELTRLDTIFDVCSYRDIPAHAHAISA